MEPSETIKTLSDVPIGGRILVRAKHEWRNAAVSHVRDGRIVLSVESRSGRTYLLYLDPDAKIITEHCLMILATGARDNWRDNRLASDRRW